MYDVSLVLNQEHWLGRPRCVLVRFAGLRLVPLETETLEGLPDTPQAGFWKDARF